MAGVVVGGPGIAIGLNDVLSDGEGGGEGADLQEVGAVVGQVDHKGALVGSGDAQGGGVGLTGVDRGVALHHVDHVAVIGGGQGVGQALPGVHEVVGGDGLAVGPLGVGANLEGVGHRAVAVVGLLIALGLAGRQRGVVHVTLFVDGVAAVAPLHQALKHMLGHDGAVHGGVQSGVDGLGLGRDAHRHVEALGRGALGGSRGGRRG